METFFEILTNVIIIGGLILKVITIASVIFRAHEPVERIIRSSAFSSAILIFFGARAFGISISEMIIRAVMVYKPFAFGLVGVIFPSIIGIAVAWYFINSIKRSANVALRIMILVGTFAVIQFADVYFTAIKEVGFIIDKALVPNLAFTLSISLFVILKYDPKK